MVLSAVHDHTLFTLGLINLLVGVRGEVVEVKFKDWGGAVVKILCPVDQLWYGIKDVLLLEEYEMLPVFTNQTLDTIVDAGAHVGLYTLKVARKAGQVIALEPHPLNYKLLRENIRRNSLTNKVHTMRAALWRERIPVTLFEGATSAAHSIFGSSGKAFSCPSVTLHDILHEWGYVDLMKMDIEGAEHDVLIGASDDLRRIGRLVAELHPGLYGAKGLNDIFVSLIESGFDVLLVRPPTLQRDSYLIWKIVKSSLEGLSRLKLLVMFSNLVNKLFRIYEPPLMMLYAWRS
jgi:FkbM family methyltransferase